MKTLFLASAAIALSATIGSAQETLSLPTTSPSAPTSTPMALLPIPLPNNGLAVGGQYGATGGLIVHQPHGGGYTTNSGTVALPSGTSFGGSVTTAPNGSVIGGGMSFGTRF